MTKRKQEPFAPQTPRSPGISNVILKRHTGKVRMTEAGIAAMEQQQLPRSKRERKIADIAREWLKP